MKITRQFHVQITPAQVFRVGLFVFTGETVFERNLEKLWKYLEEPALVTKSCTRAQRCCLENLTKLMEISNKD